MNRRLALLLVLAGLAASPGEATDVACEDHFLLPNLDLSFCSNYCRRSDTGMLYYSGLAEALSAYLVHLQERAAIQGKKLEIEAQPAFGNAGPAVCLTRSPNAFHVEFRYGYPASEACEGISGLRDFVRIVDYFASSGWQSFCYDYRTVPCATALHSFERLLDREVGQPDMSFFEGRQTVVFKLDDLQIVDEGDRLFYVMAGRRLDLEPGDPTPVKVGERYLFGSRGAIHVYENGSEILRKAWEHDPSLGPFRAQASRTWVNLGYLEGPQLSYSAKENRFHEVPAGRRPSDWGGGFGGCGRVYPPQP